MKREALKERMELLELGEALGFPRLGYGRSSKIPHDKRIPAGQSGWEKFCAHAHVNRILPALRISRVLREHGVKKYNPLEDAETNRHVTDPVTPVARMTDEQFSDLMQAATISADLTEEIT
jgi:hypothetical protein